MGNVDKQDDLADHAIAIVAVINLRTHFLPVANFLANPQDTIKRAGSNFRGNSIEVYRAQMALLLNIGTYLDAAHNLNVTSHLVYDFTPTPNAEYGLLFAKILETHNCVEACTASLRHGLNVISGKEEKFLNIDIPKPN